MDAQEVGKRDFQTEFEFLKQHYKNARIMLRYAIERFDPELRQQFLNGSIDNDIFTIQNVSMVEGSK